VGDTRDRILLTFFGSGYFPVAPGTAGSLASLLLGAAIYNVLPPEYQPFLFPVLAVLAMAGCVLPGERIEDLFGRKDPGAVVIDEAAGQYMALSVVPWLPQGWAPWVAAFLLFRLFDITKPLGIRKLEQRPAGWGVLLDDVAAGAVSAILLLILQQFPGDLLGRF
jgi:phosphatidylglycerophosphatase A